MSADEPATQDPGATAQGAGTEQPPADVAELRQEIADTREQLGRTVEQVAAKADIKAQAGASMRRVGGRLSTSADTARAKAAGLKAKAADRLDAATNASHADPGTRTARWRTASEPAGGLAARVTSEARRHPVPAAAAGMAGMLLLGWILGCRKRR